MLAVDVKASVGAGLFPRLPSAAKVVLLGDAVSALGQGMSLPFLLIYLHEVLRLDMSTAGLVALR